MTPIQYTTIEDILKEAGFYHIQQHEKLDGAIDGQNKAFLTAYKPIYNVEAVVVMVNGVKADIGEINANQGIVNLTTAPEAGAEVLADYYYSAVDADFVSKVRDEAQSFIDSFMRGYDDCFPYQSDNIPSVIEQVCRLYAAGLLLIRDYGYNTDTELTSKDGYKKIAFAKETLTDFRSSGGACGNSGGDNDGSGLVGMGFTSQGDFFGKDRRCGGCDG